jgi:predicted ester cyclase
VPSHSARAVVECYVDIHRTGDTSGLDAIIAPDFHYRASPPVGPAGVAKFLRELHAGFSDIACSIEQCVAEGDWAAFRFVIAGTHTSVFAGRAPTGRRITWPGADFVRLREGQFVELWAVQESLPLMEGLGAVRRVET